MMADARRNVVRRRAHFRCEYCQLPEAHAAVLGFHIDHIIADQHGGRAIMPNLALACHHCNLHKGPNISGIDPATRKLVRLFHPRRMKWQRHFRWEGPLLLGRTAIGRATIAVLNINEEDRVNLRQALIDEAVFPP